MISGEPQIEYMDRDRMMFEQGFKEGYTKALIETQEFTKRSISMYPTFLYPISSTTIGDPNELTRRS